MYVHEKDIHIQLYHTFIKVQLGLKLRSTGNINPAVKELRGMAHRAHCVVKRQCHVEISIKMRLKILESVIEAIAFYGSEVCGPLTNQELAKWEKHPTETLLVEFCKKKKKVHGTPERMHAGYN